MCSDPTLRPMRKKRKKNLPSNIPKWYQLPIKRNLRFHISPKRLRLPITSWIARKRTSRREKSSIRPPKSLINSSM
jgi:hypothetical protein